MALRRDGHISFVSIAKASDPIKSDLVGRPDRIRKRLGPSRAAHINFNNMTYYKLTYRFPAFPHYGEGVSYKYARTPAEAKTHAQKALRAKAEFISVIAQ